MSDRISPMRTALLAAVLVVVLLAGQVAADRLAPSADSLGTGQAVRRASSAYLSGLGVFAGQVLWNRIEPLFHEYYESVPLAEQLYVLPTLNAINMLDPQFEQPFYIAPWILAGRGETEAALQVALRGVENNPKSGLLRTSYAQILALYGDDIDAAYEQARIAASDDVVWFDDIEKHDAYSILRFVYKQAGDTAGSEELLHEIDRLDALIGDQLPAGAHDHDGDGTPDH